MQGTQVNVHWRNWYALMWLLLLLATRPTASTAGQSLTSSSIHRTQAATERVNDLWCYECDTMDHGETCVDVLNKNTSAFVKKCKGEEFICMVKRFSYTTSTENSTSSPKMWSLDRRCAINCEPGCIIIGERTKLYACTSCCEKSFCNTGRGGAAATIAVPQPRRLAATGIGVLLLMLILPMACLWLHNDNTMLMPLSNVHRACSSAPSKATGAATTITTKTTTTYPSAELRSRLLRQWL